ncbi:MAG: CaiB/BaiF CoA-transferase family protein [Pseudomonadales bacterium]|jgi:crotonobetainyl-CoA:carnitine CoA-transferase CaiB-like acyl-CoA transferase|nr:CaiB/BaiF CoA-transferase family protein [Pseudomonadales bacterium]
MSDDRTRPEAPLGGLLVIELANVLAGPATGMFLAELGARVIKVEHPAGGDPTRGWRLEGEAAPSEVSAYFSSTNWGKESITLDLSRPEGRAVVHDLVRRADVVLQSFKPGDDLRFETDDASLRRLQPALIHGVISAYGSADPRPGFDAVIQAEAGFTYMNGDPEGPPTKMPVALMDLLAAHQLKEGILLALLRRERTGQGRLVEVSLLDAGLAALANQATNWLVGGRIPQRMGSAHPNVVPYGTLYGTADGDWIVLAVGTDRQFAALARAIGAPELADDARFRRNADRVRHRAELDGQLQQAFGQRGTGALVDALGSEGVPFGQVNDMRAVFAQDAADRLRLQGQLADGSPVAAVRTAVFTPAGERLRLRPPPGLGADTRAILDGLLAYGPARIDQLLASGALGDQDRSEAPS